MIRDRELKNNAVMPVTLKRRGRPSISDSGTEKLQVRITVEVYDNLCRIAREQNKPLAEVAREVLSKFTFHVE